MRNFLFFCSRVSVPRNGGQVRVREAGERLRAEIADDAKFFLSILFFLHLSLSYSQEILFERKAKKYNLIYFHSRFEILGRKERNSEVKCISQVMLHCFNDILNLFGK